MKIEVIFYDRIGSYYNGQVVELDDGPFLRAILQGGKADVLNPPDWHPDKFPDFKEEIIIWENDTESKVLEKSKIKNPNRRKKE